MRGVWICWVMVIGLSQTQPVFESKVTIRSDEETRITMAR